MIYVLLISSAVFVGVVFYLAKLVVLGLEQKADEDVLKAKDTYGRIIEQKDRSQAEKAKLEREAVEIFTLYDMTRDITRHFDEQGAFNIFLGKLKESVHLEDCRLVHDIDEGFKGGALPSDYAAFILKSKEKKLGALLYKGLEDKDKEKFAILAHQFALALRRLKLYKDIETLALTDGLTGVYTRRYFIERFDEEIKRSGARKSSLAFLMVDADHFKAINDQYGHLTGDQVLKEVANIIRENVREIDIVGRFGGEEFCVVLPDTDPEGSRVVAERIRKSAERKPIRAYDNTVHLTLSLGTAIFPTDGKLLEELMDKADWALYRAKSQGRNCVVAFGSYQNGGASKS
ncbi:MAG: GGDEF domain-containing protein [Candidatus Omnitrophica bacterium]|nr:GGDEF domain-containing protein [Candidatus Omnitrophota bacterium]MDE2010193.1 GGDEF domain-containing protein [Candidatus Omnitrophota bacterium]MDE2215081.1 GGDEF domain-containing protein [Candidatus Omnitrophota bacterium]MDE2232202.1 GGDEF domain-containing protein [Candidatus Omnitrophota bacterium]